MRFALSYLDAADRIYAAMRAGTKGAPCPGRARGIAAFVRDDIRRHGEATERIALFERNYGAPFPTEVCQLAEGGEA